MVAAPQVAARQVPARRRWLTASAVLVLILLILLVSQVRLASSTREDSEIRLNLATTSIAHQLQTELTRLTDLAVDLEVALRPHEQLDGERFAAVMADLAVDERFPLLAMVGYTDLVDRDDLGDYLAARARAREPLVILDDAGYDQLRPIRYVHPADFGHALGRDANAIDASRNAAAQVVATGAPQLTAKTQIPVGDGAALQVPMRASDGTVTGTLSLLLPSDGLLASLEPLPAPLEVRLLDPDADHGTFSARIGSPAASSVHGLGSNPVAVQDVGVGDHAWRIEVRPSEGFLAPVGQRPTTTAGLMVLALLLLVSLVVRDLVSRERSARASATHSSTELELANAQLTVSNDALADANHRLIDSNRRLRELDELKDGLLAGVSHEIRTPLTVIGGVADTLERLPGDDPRARPLLRSLRRSVHRLDGMLDDLLTLASVDAGAARVRAEDLRVGDVVAGVVAGHPPALAGSLVCQVDPDAWVRADPRHLHRVLDKLLTNALEHGQPPVWIRAVVEGAEVVLTVSDHGAGLHGDEHHEVFARFARGRDADRSRGTGLGLAIVDALVSLNDGTVRSVPSDTARVLPGACFELRLAAAEWRPAHGPPCPLPSPPAATIIGR